MSTCDVKIPLDHDFNLAMQNYINICDRLLKGDDIGVLHVGERQALERMRAATVRELKKRSEIR